MIKLYKKMVKWIKNKLISLIEIFIQLYVGTSLLLKLKVLAKRQKPSEVK